MNYKSQNSVSITPQNTGWVNMYSRKLHHFKIKTVLIEYSIAWKNSHNISLREEKQIVQQNV